MKIKAFLFSPQIRSGLCPGQESNLHDLKRSLGPQPSASTNSATWALVVSGES